MNDAHLFLDRVVTFGSASGRLYPFLSCSDGVGSVWLKNTAAAPQDWEYTADVLILRGVSWPATNMVAELPKCANFGSTNSVSIPNDVVLSV